MNKSSDFIVNNNEGSCVEEPDDVLVLRSKNGAKEAFDILVQRYRDSLFRFVYHNLRQKEDAEDITQESFVRAYLSLYQLKDNRLFKSWLFKIALNLIRDNERLAKRKHTISLDSLEGDREFFADAGDAEVEGNLEREELRKRLEKEITSLPIELREAITLRDLQGFSYEEIARLLRCSLGTVKSRLFNARKMLREKLRDILEDEKDEL